MLPYGAVADGAGHQQAVLEVVGEVAVGVGGKGALQVLHAVHHLAVGDQGRRIDGRKLA